MKFPTSVLRTVSGQCPLIAAVAISGAREMFQVILQVTPVIKVSRSEARSFNCSFSSVCCPDYLSIEHIQLMRLGVLNDFVLALDYCRTIVVHT